ncbi:MAG: ATP-dependent sacrificial sulfur transferase LarE [Deltaproteobacteria bacterium]|nr:ATP-dependent sacrificial sulfur transferase LarE [Deltaproteobacteria bacterium]
MSVLEEKRRLAESIIKKAGPLAVAFSGGADSSLLLALAREALGEGVLGITVDSPIVPRRELAAAKALAASLGVRHIVVPGREMELSEFSSNPRDRCWFCKRSHLAAMLEAGRKEGFPALVHGANADDSMDYRPGLLAAKEMGIAAPLAEAGLTKAEIREISRSMGLSTWNKPSSACLASRIPTGSPITAEKLSAVEKAEDFLHDLGIGQLRVRHHGDTARIEVTEADFPRFKDPLFRACVADFLESVGFIYSAIDLKGYRTGSLNRPIDSINNISDSQ